MIEVNKTELARHKTQLLPMNASYLMILAVKGYP